MHKVGPVAVKQSNSAHEGEVGSDAFGWQSCHLALVSTVVAYWVEPRAT
jgi:hypothetical protein